MASYVHEQSELNVAGPPRFERGIAVLETAVIPFHHGPIKDRIYMELRDPYRKPSAKGGLATVTGRDPHTTIASWPPATSA